jgi:hypothetical protein
MLKEIKITDIKVGDRHRRDMGDLTTLADSIRQEGLLQPIGVTDRLELVFGERRIRAVRDILKKKTILARIVDVSSILAGEYHENEVRKDFTPSERVAIARAIERQVGNCRGQRVQKIAHVEPGRKTRDTAAERAGFGNHETYRQAAKVVANGSPRLIQAMDEGRVSISAASILADADPDEQQAVLELDEKAILQAAKEIRQRQTAARNHEQIEADFVAVFWSQEKVWQGRQWFEESLTGYKFQQLLIWHANNAWSPKSKMRFKESWEPIFLYRRQGCSRQVLPNGKPWGEGLHNLDCFVASVPEGNYSGEDLKQHPCQKPVAVMRWLIHALSEPGEMVCSPFCGVAPCGIAATQLGRRYHGIETSAKYRQIAERRIAAYGQSK